MSDDTIEITRTGDENRGAYQASVPGGEEAELTWVARGNARIADHTFVPNAARGKGIAEKLVLALVEDAKSKGFKIVPACSYVAAQFRRHPEWAELRAETAS